MPPVPLASRCATTCLAILKFGVASQVLLNRLIDFNHFLSSKAFLFVSKGQYISEISLLKSFCIPFLLALFVSSEKFKSLFFSSQVYHPSSSLLALIFKKRYLLFLHSSFNFIMENQDLSVSTYRTRE
jgi:hypothetical protein